MLETMMKQDWILWAMWSGTVLSAIGGCLSWFAMWRLRCSAEVMNKSEHRLMRLVKAKFEHASMLSDRVANVNAFVRKYLYEYRVAGIRLHRLCRVRKNAPWLVICLGVIGMACAYRQYGMGEVVVHYGLYASVLGSGLIIFSVIGDPEQYFPMIENAMVDYLENVFAPRLEHAKKREQELETVQVEETKDSTAEAVGQEVRVRKILEEYFA